MVVTGKAAEDDDQDVAGSADEPPAAQRAGELDPRVGRKPLSSANPKHESRNPNALSTIEFSFTAETRRRREFMTR
jgi:hypothetical protein